MDIQSLWTTALGELSLQMTKATFDTWVRDTQALEFDDGCLVVGVANQFARDWLENRLTPVVERTLTGILGYPVRVTFLVVAKPENPEPSPEEEGESVVAVRFYDFDPRQRGFLQSPKYDLWFWQPMLGLVTFAVYQFLRSLDRQNTGWGEWHFLTVEEIAATVTEGNRQLVTGVQRRRRGTGEKYWQKGAFDRLIEAALAKVETLGRGKNVSYRVSCLNNLPLLTPTQVETLPPVVQAKHSQFLKECDIEYEEWEQLELPTLVRE